MGVKGAGPQGDVNQSGFMTYKKPSKQPRVFWKLYQVEPGSRISGDFTDGSASMTFHRIDGMYSNGLTEKGNAVHLRAVTELRKVGPKHYSII